MTETPTPKDFKEWLGPWALGWISEYGPEGTSHSRRWSRLYREQSHCDTDGCCELEYPLIGPQIGPTLAEGAPHTYTVDAVLHAHEPYPCVICGEFRQHTNHGSEADIRHAAVWDWIAKQDAALGEPWGD